MRSPIIVERAFERALSLTLVALALVPIACREDNPQRPAENATGGSGGRGGRGGTGGAKVDAAAGGAGGTVAKPDAGASDLSASDVADEPDATTVSDAWVGSDSPI